jgi:hypothetical protein
VQPGSAADEKHYLTGSHHVGTGGCVVTRASTWILHHPYSSMIQYNTSPAVSLYEGPHYTNSLRLCARNVHAC